MAGPRVAGQHNGTDSSSGRDQQGRHDHRVNNSGNNSSGSSNIHSNNNNSGSSNQDTHQQEQQQGGHAAHRPPDRPRGRQPRPRRGRLLRPTSRGRPSTPTTCDMGIGTFNLNRLNDQLKLDLILEGLQQHGVHILLGQETWHGPATHLRIPTEWTMLSFPHPDMGATGRGLLLLASSACLRDRGWSVVLVSQRSTEHHDYMAVRMGPWLLVSVYVPCTRTTGPNYRQLALEIAALRATPRQRLLVGGDFNWPDKRQELEAVFYEELGLLPLLQPPLISRPGRDGDGGTLIDNIFYPEEEAFSLTYAGPMDVEPSPLLDAYLGGPRSAISDHHLVVGSLPLSCRPPGRSSMATGGARVSPPRISYRRLERWLASARQGGQQGDAAQRAQQAEAKLDELRDRIKAMSQQGLTDLADFRDLLKHHLRQVLGQWRPRLGMRKAHLSVPEAQAALREKQKQRKRWDRALRTRASAATLARHQQAMNKTSRKWQDAQERAMQAAKLQALQRCRQASEVPGANMRTIFKIFRQAKGRTVMVVDRHPHLDPDATAAFWAGVYTRRRGDVRQRQPYCQITMVITAEMVIQAIEAMERRAPGPDGIDFLVFSTFKKELAPALAACFTRMAREGPPAALREALTILGPKAGNERGTSSSPADYRPITLLDMVMRIFHKILHILLSKEMERRTPQQGGIHRTQAGFRRQRSCLEQAFFLQLLQSVRRKSAGPGKFLGAVLLDIKKAFDSFEYDVILNIMERRGYSLELLEILRNFLPGNFTRIMGKRVAFGRGSPQGGAISPDLCLLVMDEFAADLQQAIQEDPALGDMWRHGSTLRGHQWQPSNPHPLLGLWMSLLQFADDLTLLVGSPRMATRLVEVTKECADRVGLELSNKTLLVLLSAQSRQHVRDLGHDEPLVVGDMQLQWQAHEAFRLLGVTCQAAYSSPRLGLPLPLDEGKTQRLLGAISSSFSFARDKYYVDPVALRLGIEQLLHASLLFQTAVVDIKYDQLESKSLGMVRRVLQLQPTTPTAYVQWELRLWPPRLRAHKRCLMFVYKIVHHSWVGEQLLRPFLAKCASEDRPLDDLHPIFEAAPLKRMGEVLKEYNLSWYHVYGQWTTPYEKRDKIAVKIEKELLLPAFVNYLRQRVQHGTPDLPAYHRQQLLRDMDLPSAKDAAREAALLPLYLHIGHDLPRAGIIFRALYLRFQPRGAYSRRAGCAWCGEDEGECGYHLLRCPRMPHVALVLRNRALLLVRGDVAKQAASLEQELDRLFSLSWPGMSAWRPGRADRGQQPSRDVLEAVLLYMRDAINLYSADEPAVWPLPVYTRCPPISADEQQQLLDVAPAAEDEGPDSESDSSSSP